jgi:hypothetical protein
MSTNDAATGAGARDQILPHEPRGSGSIVRAHVRFTTLLALALVQRGPMKKPYIGPLQESWAPEARRD